MPRFTASATAMDLPVTIHKTIPLPAMATNIIRPNTMAQIVFCSQGNSYGLVGEGNKHSVRKSLQSRIERKHDILKNIVVFYVYLLEKWYCIVSMHSKNKYAENLLNTSVCFPLRRRIVVGVVVVVVVMCTNQFTLQLVQ